MFINRKLFIILYRVATTRPDGHRLKIDLEREIEDDLKIFRYGFSINYFSSLNLSKLREFAIALPKLIP